MNPEEETSITEITISPDGRVFVFGASRQVLEVLNHLKLGDATVKERTEHVRMLHLRQRDETLLPETEVLTIGEADCQRGYSPKT